MTNYVDHHTFFSDAVNIELKDISETRKSLIVTLDKSEVSRPVRKPDKLVSVQSMLHDVDYFFAIDFGKLLRVYIFVAGVAVQGRDDLPGNLNRMRQT